MQTRVHPQKSARRVHCRVMGYGSTAPRAAGAWACRVLALLWAACAAAHTSGAGLAEPAFTKEALDLAACKTFRNGVASPAEPSDVLAALGLGGSFRSGHGWSAGEAGEKGDTFHYLVAFRTPVRIGSVWLDAGEFAYLKEGAPYPGDPSNAAHWAAPKVYPSQGRPHLVTLPAGTTTRAVLCTETRTHGRSAVRFWRLSPRRLHNITPDAVAQAESEFTQYSQLGPPHTYHASRVTQGSGSWQNAGANEDNKKVPRAPVSDVDPSWFVLSWDDPRTICGLYLRDNFSFVRLEVFHGPEGLSPVAAVEKEWKRLLDSREGGNDGRWLAFEPVTTRGIRLLILKTNPAPIARIEAMHVYTDLGGAPAPDFQPSRGESLPPPFQIPYTLAEDGELTLVVDNPKGRRVRNLVARADRTKGAHAEHWDLKGEDGRYVEPGSYRWKAITHPPLELRYQMTPYPNIESNAPENSPWLNGPSGPGGWLADHTPPYGVCTAGDWLFFGAPCAESGVSFIACDLNGKRKWGIHSFAAWSGPRLMATDGKTVFVENPGWGEDADTDRVWGVDIETHDVRQVVRFSGSETRKRGCRGMAARDGKLYLAIGGEADWLANATGPATVDLDNCQPRYKRKPSGANEKEADPRDDFLRGFRLKGTPPGDHGLIWLESTKGSSRREHILLAFHKPINLGSLVFPMPVGAGPRARPGEEGSHGGLPLQLRISVLKPEAPYPPSPADRSQWIPINTKGALPWDVIPAPPKTLTRALLITFLKGADDEVADILDEDVKEEGLKAEPKEKDKDERGNWLGQIEGMKLLRRRFKNLFGSAKVRVSSGTVAPDGSWDAQRKEPITPDNPGIYVLEWAKPVRVRGLAIKEIDGKRAEIDAYDGPADGMGQENLRSKERWKHLATYHPPRRYFYWPDVNHNSKARYVDGYVDFGREVTTRALRVRVVEQWISREGDRAGLYGVRADRGGLKLEPARCRIDGVAPLQSLGDEVPVDPLTAHRIEVVDAATSKVIREVPIENPGALALNPAGELFTLCGNQVVRIGRVDDWMGVRQPTQPATQSSSHPSIQSSIHPIIVSDLVSPTCLAFDAKGNLYVFDNAPDRKVIRVYDPSGRFLRTIGTPGGYRAGPWDPYRFQHVTAIAIDREGHLWVVDGTYWPKRISQWTLDGRHLRDFFGNTSYGGGGVLDPWDKRRLLYGPLEFELDWEKGTTRLKNLTWLGDSEPGELPIHMPVERESVERRAQESKDAPGSTAPKHRIYVVTRPWGPGPDMPVGIVYLHEKDHLRRLAAVGLANYFPPLRTPEILSALGRMGGKVLEDFQFMWSDRDGDGKVQMAEVVFTPKRIHGVTLFNRDLSCQGMGGKIRFKVKEFLRDGVPVYEEVEFPKLAAVAGGHAEALYRLTNGTFFKMGAPEACYTAEGEELWRYSTEGAGGHALTRASPWHPAQVVCEFGWIGHENTSRQSAEGSRQSAEPNPQSAIRNPQSEGLGEFVVLKTNVGVWNLWTSDGLLAARLFRDIRDPRRQSWSMREHGRGLRLDDVTAGQEHFCGYFCRSFQDDKFYVVAGHNHASVVEVIGLDKFRRLGGGVTVTGDDVRKVQEWERLNAKRQARANVRVIDCYRRLDEIKIDGDPKDWDAVPPTPLFTEDYAKIHRISYNAAFRMAYDDECLYLCYETRGLGPLANSGNQWDRLFKTGGSVDIQMGTDEAADPNRKAPVAGDVRLLMTYAGDKPMTVLYRAVVPGAREDQVWKVVSPVFQVSFDQVIRLDGVRLARSGGANGYVLEAAVPLKAIGLAIANAPNKRLKLDWGILATDEGGSAVLSRTYWANKATAILSDAPSEAALHPDLWGYVRFFDRTRRGLRLAEPKDLLRGKDHETDKLELEEP